jgi:hypothetical protein
MFYTNFMTQSFASRITTSRLLRNILAIGATVVIVFFVFRAVAAFNDVLKMYNSMPVVSPQAYTCPKGYALVNIGKTDKKECIPAASATPGVVAVGLAPAEKTASKPVPPATQPGLPKPTPPKPAQ